MWGSRHLPKGAGPEVLWLLLFIWARAGPRLDCYPPPSQRD